MKYALVLIFHLFHLLLLSCAHPKKRRHLRMIMFKREWCVPTTTTTITRRRQATTKIISSFSTKLLHFYLSTAENKHSNKKITNATKKLFTSVCSLGKLLLYKWFSLCFDIRAVSPCLQAICHITHSLDMCVYAQCRITEQEN